MTPARPWSAREDRAALAAVATQFFVNGAVFGSVSPRLPEIRDQVGISAGRVGVIMSIAGLGGLVGSAFVGRAIERLGTRWTMVGAATIVALALPVVGLAESQPLLALGLVLMLTFDVPVDVAMNLQGSWLSARRPVPVMNRLHGLWSLGTVGGGVVSSRLAQAGVSITTHLIAASAVLLVLIAVISRGLLADDPEPSADSAESVDPKPTDDRIDRCVSGRRRRRTPRSARTTGLVLLALAGYTALAVESTSIDWPAFRFTDDLGTSAATAAWAYVAVTGGMTVGRFAGDWVAARLGHDRMMDIAMVTTGCGLAVALLVDRVPVSLVGYGAAGLGIAVFLPEIYDRAAKFPGRPGAGLGALTAGIRLAALTVPLTVGLMVDGTGSIGLAVAFVALPAVAGFAAVVWRFRIDRRSVG